MMDFGVGGFRLRRFAVGMGIGVDGAVGGKRVFVALCGVAAAHVYGRCFILGCSIEEFDV